MIDRKPILRIDAAGLRRQYDDVVIEEPLEIRVRGRAVSVTMRTPGHDEELAVGFLLSEGIVCRPGDVLRVEPCGRNEHGNLVNVQLAPAVHVDFDRLTRHVFASSSCGLCGAATIESVRKLFPPVISGCRISVETLLALPERMRTEQAAFDRTGALHAAAVFDRDGRLLVLREDVGRHNAVDKVLGRILLDGRVPVDDAVLLVSGRASFEIVQKAQSAGVAIVAAVSGPSSLAVDLATEGGQTLIGFLRPGRMNVYSGAERLVPPPCTAGEGEGEQPADVGGRRAATDPPPNPLPEHREREVAAYILAGGKGSRFGGDKARALLRGRAMILHVADLLAPFAGRPRVVGGNLDDLGLESIADRAAGLGPVSGLHAALHDSPAEWVLAMPCDLLGVDPAWVEELLAARSAGADAVAFRGAFWQPFPGLYRRTLLPRLERLIAESAAGAGRGPSMQRLLDEAHTRALPLPDDWPSRVAQVNTPRDLDDLERAAPGA